MKTIPELVLAWLACTTEKEKASVEASLRELSSDKADYWIAQQLPAGSTGPRHVMDRSILFRAGAAAEPIWVALAAKTITLRTGGIIIARSRDDGQKPTPEKVVLTIQQYLAGTLDVKRPSAKRRGPSHKKTEPVGVKTRNEGFYAAIDGLFDQMLVGVPEFAAHNIRSAGRADLLALMNTWRNVIARARVADPEKLSEAVRTKRLNAAMRVLNLDPPSDGEYTSKVLGKIKTQFHRLARLYHPDTAGSNPALEEEYRNVVDAHSCIRMLLAPNP